MSTIEDKVVSLKFDNKQFQSGVAESLQSVEKLNTGLKMEGATQGLDNVANSARRLTFGEAISGAGNLISNMSVLGVSGIAALGGIASKAVSVGADLIKSLSIEPALDGFQEYEMQLNSVQTILANTASKGEDINSVNAALDELNTYADQTIYNFSEMTRNIGTFTAAGVGLKDSVSAIKGLSNLAAASGSTSAQASTAMYQLSQAIATGTVRLMDWNSVVNAGMGGEQFQEALKRTARIHGEAVDEAIAKEGSFRDSLQDGWLTSEVMLETLSLMTGDYSEEAIRAMGYTEVRPKRSWSSRRPPKVPQPISRPSRSSSEQSKRNWAPGGPPLGESSSATSRKPSSFGPASATLSRPRSPIFPAPGTRCFWNGRSLAVGTNSFEA